MPVPLVGPPTREQLIKEFAAKKRRGYIFERRVYISLAAIIAVAVVTGLALQAYDDATRDKVPPIISGISASDITYNSATVTWTTDEKTTGRVQYGTCPFGGFSAASESGSSTSHMAVLTGLASNRTYCITVWSTDGSENTAKLEGGSFTTSPLPPAQ